MTADQWRQAWEIFQASQSVPEGDRDSFAASRTTDSAVIARVAAMFDQEEEEDGKPVGHERTPGDRIGRYVLDEQIGRGSYGEVWSGRDTELGRRVALKFISPERQGDHDAARRIVREARAASALNHPHIVVVHEVVASESGPVIVMELVDGAPLRSMMGAPMPADKAGSILGQILKALASAHAAGVVHRDLKPENIVVRPDGFVKVLDFGLARQVVDATNSAASAGLSLGTLRYMAPEQCRGESASPASDVFAAGVVLYELLAGQHPFESSSWLDTVNEIVGREPRAIDGPCAALALRMLSKAPADRPTAAEALQGWDGGADSAVKRGRRWVLPALAAGVALLAWFGFQRAGGTNDRNVRLTDTRLDLGAHTTIDERNFALSPDGRKLLFHSGSSIQVLNLAGGPAVELKGVAGQSPFWSPDGKEFGYFANGKLWRKGFPDGPSREICDAPNMSSAHWGSADLILFASSSDAPISRVHPDGGKPVQVIPFEPDAKRHEAPFLLPDGRHFVYWSANNRRIGNLMLAALDGKESPRVLARTASSAIYVPQPDSTVGALVYRANGGLMALPFNSSSNQVRGDAKMFAERTSRLNHKIVPASASARGDLVYREADDRRLQVKIFDRRGQLLEKVAAPKEYTAAVPSPDFKRLALIVDNAVTGRRDLEFYDFQTRRTTLIPDAVAPGNPTWAPDSATLIAGNGSVSGGADFYRISISATGAPVVSTIPWKKKAAAWPSDWALDGKSVVLVADDPRTDFDIWTLPLYGRGEPRPLIATPAREQRASLSPDGKLLLYMSDESKTSEIWVTPNPPDGRKWKVSTGGGQEPKWRGDGKEIFYQSMDYALLSVRVGGASGQPSFNKPELLFGGRSGDPALMVWHCEPSADGQRFVILTGPIQNTAAPLRLRLNWWAEGR